MMVEGCQARPCICPALPSPTRWVVVWRSPELREAYFADHALADAYAAAHHGEVVPMVNLAPWPGIPSISR